MSSIQARLDKVEMRFRRGSKSYNIARWLVQQNRVILDSERGPIATEFGLARSTVNGIVNKLTELGCYGDIVPASNIPSIQEPPQTIIPPPTNPIQPTQDPPIHAEHTPQIESPPGAQEYATKADLERLETAIVGLADLFVDDEGDEYEEDNQDPEDPTPVNPTQPPMTPQEQRAILDDSSMKQMGTWIFAKNLLYFDFARQGTFGGALENFDGNWSDFVNIVIEDYFVRTSNVGIGLLSRKFA